jgi:hypothetical protein
MKQLIMAALLLAPAMGMSACNKINGEGPVITEERSVSAFSRLYSDISGDVYYTPDSIYRVSIRAQRNILDVLNTTVNGNRLTIEFKPGKWVGRHDRIEVYVSGPDVTALSVNGSGDLKVTKAFHPHELDVEVNGSGSISIPELVTGNINTEVNGSGDIRILNGTAVNVHTEISGSGTIDVIGIAARTADTHTAGSGDTYVQVSDALNVHTSGSGDVYYRGNPRISKDISGSGKVIAK